MHRALGVHAERYPLSGASRFRGAGHDVDLYIHGRDEAPAVAEVKARKSGAGFTTLEKWLGEYDALFLKRNNADPLIVMPWRVWASLIQSKNFKVSSAPAEEDSATHVATKQTEKEISNVEYSKRETRKPTSKTNSNEPLA
jgi:hypothetical protein